METIAFRNVLPHVFEQGRPLASDIWQKDVVFRRGHRYLVEADSGRGKSTFCSYVLGYRRDYTGDVLFDGKDIRRLDVAQWSKVRRQDVACLFQELRLFPELTAFENVDIKNRLTGYKSRRQIEQWFELLGIADKTGVPADMLSLGQQQRVALMRALVQPFSFILADEPVSHLDDANAHAMAQLIRDEAKAQDAAVIATSIGRHLPLEYEYTLHL